MSYEQVATVEAALNRLAALGSPRAIADELVARGITGPRGVARRCPGKQAVTAETGIEVLIGQYYWRLGALRGMPWRDLPSIMSQFVCRFDAGDFPELDDGTGDEDVTGESDTVEDDGTGDES